MINYSMEGRTYRFFKGPGPPLYPYGYGLSYTYFKYTFLDINPKIIRGETNITVSVGLANVGSYDSDEVLITNNLCLVVSSKKQNPHGSADPNRSQKMSHILNYNIKIWFIFRTLLMDRCHRHPYNPFY